METLDTKQAAVLREAQEMGTLISELSLRVIKDVRLKIQAALTADTTIPEELEIFLATIETGVDKLKPLLARLTPEETEFPKLNHAIRNALNSIGPFAEFIQTDMPALGSDFTRLELIKSVSSKLGEFLSEISSAIQGKKNWEDITVTDLTKDSGEIVPLNGKNFLIIDDDASIAQVAGKKIVKAGGMYEYHNGEGNEWPNQDFAVILLDHHLTGQHRGYELVEILRTKYPSAKIIVHSAAAHDTEEMKPYQNLPKISKLAWTELNKHL